MAQWASYLPYAIGAGIVLFLLVIMSPRLRLRHWNAPRFLRAFLGPGFARSHAIKEAQSLRQEGDFAGAAKAFEDAGMLAEAAESYMQGGDSFRAAAIREQQGQTEGAAELYRQAGDYRRAGDLFVAVGRTGRAAEAYAERGDFLEAARLFSEEGEWLRAADLFLRAGHAARAAKEYERAGHYRDAAEAYERDFRERFGNNEPAAAVPDADRSSALLAGRMYEQAKLLPQAQSAYLRGGFMREAGITAAKLKDSARATDYFLAAGDRLSAAEAAETGGNVALGARLRAEAALEGDRLAEAASFFQKSGEFEQAASLFKSLGMDDRAAAALDAARNAPGGSASTAERSISDVTHDFYDAISGPIGAARDWARAEADLWPTCRFNIAERQGDGSLQVRSITPDEFRREADGPLRENGFFEIETGREEHLTGDVASVLSHYEARFTPDGPVIYSGTNHLHLIRNRGRWWMVSATWERSPKAPVKRPR